MRTVSKYFGRIGFLVLLVGAMLGVPVAKAADAVNLTDGMVGAGRNFQAVDPSFDLEGELARRLADPAPQSTFQPTSSASIITSTGAGGNWNNGGTWVGGIIPGATDDVIIADGATVTLDIAASCASLAVGQGFSGVFEFETALARTLTVSGNVTINSGGTLRSNLAGTVITHVLSVGGNLTNNGTLDLSTNVNTAGAGLTFTGATSNTFGGSGGTTDIRTLTINKGTSNANVLELNPSTFSVQGTTTDGTPMAYLTLTNGTLKISGSFGLTGRTFTTAGYTLGTTVGFWLNNPNYVVSGQNGSPTVNWLRVSQGLLNIGTATGNSMGFSANATVTVEGGAINATGRFGVAAAGNALNYTQTGGIITVCTIGNASTTLASFDLGTGVGADPIISGGNIIIRLANTSATVRDYRNEQGNTGNGIIGGTVQFGDASSGTAKAFQANGIFPNVVVTNTSANHTLLMRAPAFFFNNVLNTTVSSGCTFNLGVGANNLLFVSGNSTFTNNGTLVSNSAGNRFVYFTAGANGVYAGTGVSTGVMTSLESQAGSVTMNQSNNLVVRRVIIFSGNFINSGKITLGDGTATLNLVQIGNTTSPTAAGTFDAPFVFNLGTGGQTISYLRTSAARSTGPEVNPGRSLVTFTQDDTAAFPPHPLTLSGGDITATTTLALTNGRIVTGASKVIANGTVTRTAGHVDGFLQKPVTVGAAVARTFEIGASNGYTPVSVNFATVTVAGALVAKSTTGDHPNIGTSPVNPLKSVNRYYTLTNLGTTFTTATETATFLPADIDGGANFNNFVTGKYDSPNWSATTTGTRTATSTQATGITSFSDFQIGEAQWSITASAGAGGSIAPSGVTFVADGGSQAYTITPDACFVIADVLVDGVSVGAVANYNFTGVTANHTIAASFTAAPAYTITASAGVGGIISPSGAVAVACGADQNFIITPDDCHTIADVLVDGVSVGNVASYEFSDVAANHTIAASFDPIVYIIAASAGAGGSISPSGSINVACTDDQSFTITPDACYSIADVLVDGISVGPVANYTFMNVTNDHTIAASFIGNAYTITASAGPGGNISPIGAVNVTCGNDQEFIISPDPCYSILDVLVDGVSVGPTGNYEFFDVSANHTIDATFEQRDYTITATAGPGGNIIPGGANIVPCGDDASFLIEPDICYHIVDVLVDGVSQGVITNYTFMDVMADHTIDVTFAITTFTITATAGPNGTINPSGAVIANCGEDQKFTFTPAAGFDLCDVIVDGVSIGITQSYTFSNVGEDHTIHAEFCDSECPVVNVVAPNGGESLIIGVPYPIDWTATDNVGVTCVDILISRTGPIGPFTAIATCIPNSPPYLWNVTGPITANAFIRVAAHDAYGSCKDQSDAAFSIIEFTVPVLLSQFAANPIANGVELRWELSEATMFARVGIERADVVDGAFTTLAEPITVENGQSVMVDHSAIAGNSYFYRIAGITRDGQVVTFAPLEATAGRPVTEFALAPIANNPARENVRIAFSVPRDSHVRLSVVDVQGRPVATLIDDVKTAGSYQATWSGDSDKNGRAPSGIYFILMEAANTKLVQRVALVH